MQVAGKTDRGLVRETNEDSIFFDQSVFIVADGMGGHLAGDVASHDAIICIRDFLDENAKGAIDLVVVEAIKYANKYIFNKAKSDAKYKGMGTTVTLAAVAGNELFYSHVGDSRFYLFRNNEFEKITSDHSLVAQLLESGQITEEQAAQHPNKHVITKAVGTAAEVEPDQGSIVLETGDIGIICSDGLTNMVKERDIIKIINKNAESPQEIVSYLMHAAKQAGGKDNISVICFKY